MRTDQPIMDKHISDGRSRLGQQMRVGAGIGIGLLCGLLLRATGGTQTAAPIATQNAAPPATLTFYGSPQSPIASGVVVPAGRTMLFTSGTVPPVLDKNAMPGSRERYGDTKTQAEGALRTIQTQLKEHGLTLADVIYLRVYVVPDPQKGGKPDFQGWFDAYAEFFNNKTNTTKTARSTISVPALVSPDLLIEIEAVAVYPK